MKFKKVIEYENLDEFDWSIPNPESVSGALLFPFVVLLFGMALTFMYPLWLLMVVPQYFSRRKVYYKKVGAKQ